MAVAVVDVDVEHVFELTAAEGQDPVEALVADSANPALGVRVGVRCLDWGADDGDALGAENLVEGGAELVVTVVDEEPVRLLAFARLRACWATQRPSGLLVHATYSTRRVGSHPALTGRVLSGSAFVAEFDSAREIGAPFDKIRPGSALGDDQEAVAAFNDVLDVWEFVTRHDKETVCRPVDLSELVKRKLDRRRA